MRPISVRRALPCARRLPQNMHVSPDEIQVLTPTRKGETGTRALNRLLQQALNPAAPDKHEKRHGETIFREGDRVMQIRNNYDLIWNRLDGPGMGSGIFNGDVGAITAIDNQAQGQRGVGGKRGHEKGVPVNGLADVVGAEPRVLHLED